MMKLLTLAEVRAQLGGLHRSTIYRLVRARRLPGPLRLGGRILFDEAELEQYLAARKAERDAGAAAEARGGPAGGARAGR